MAWEDRDYAPRDNNSNFGSNPFLWLIAGRVPLFEVFGIRVVAHASMLVISVLVLLFGTPFGTTVLDRLTFVIVLFGVVLLHEFGHAFAARWSGGSASEIELTPLGGLALVMPGKGWWRHTVTVAGGPLVNVVICLVCAVILLLSVGFFPLGPFSFFFDWGNDTERPAWFAASIGNVAFYAYYVYSISYFLLLFNLLPFFPLDGGQLVQGIGWRYVGWFRATLFATALGMVGGVLMVMYGIASASLLVALIGITPVFLTSFQLRRQLKAEGEWAFSEMEEPDYAASLRDDYDDKPTRAELRQQRREERAEAKRRAIEAAEAEELDRVLAKVGASGLDSLSKSERRVLEDATAKRRGG
jgi:Zn-dependent protease